MNEPIDETVSAAEKESPVETAADSNAATASAVDAAARAESEDEAGTDDEGSVLGPRGRSGSWPARLAVLACVVVATIAVVFGIKWHSAQSELDDARAVQEQIAAATALAKSYTLRSPTYDYRNMNAFFDGVAKDATDSLKAEYRKARPDLQTLMTTAQVVASGRVVATSVLSSSDDRYEFAVTALQKTKNLQQPEEQVVPNILKVVLVRHEGGLLVDKYSAM